MAEGTGRDIRLKVLSCRPTYQGRNKSGVEFTIYEIEAAKPNGEPIKEKLRSFMSLPIGQEIEVNVKPYNSEQYGRSFTLHPKNARSANYADAVNELTEQVEQQREMIASQGKRISTLEDNMAKLVGGKLLAAVDEGIERGLSEGATEQLASIATTANGQEQRLDAAFGKDVPF